ncbi:MAG: metallophosphoesterase [Woeseiaceae bacterium]|nr:metallophosphoesterase [Woeseiaceae bacterium]
MSYDLIGDIHGHAGPLVELLEKLGYEESDGIYRHPDRQVIFLGDFIDRGPEQREVIDIVRPMIDSDTAFSVMGNHEFNAIAYATESSDDDGNYLRPHTEKNRTQHQAFLDAYQDSDEYHELIQWFRHLPLWLDFDDLRVVHACWDDKLMHFLEKRYPGVNDYFDGELLAAASTKGRTEFKAVETLLKGREVPLPKGQHFHDKDGNPRHEIRVRWWDADAKSYRDAFLGPDAALSHIPEDPLDVDHEIVYSSDAPPVFVGHYWMDGEPAPLAPNIACLDYSIAAPKGGRLVAYRWDGEQELDKGKFVSVTRG